ncbi:hypothetical protein LCGC14_2072780 [marine sediment metagenome]|uniref:Resolvase/invertase-type recombinase catalytic domain-containing protein n=1 Tax=marine sediment metagenome TaxID=412755 RepID=A0A0F9F581_9ZZZZ
MTIIPTPDPNPNPHPKNNRPDGASYAPRPQPQRLTDSLVVNDIISGDTPPPPKPTKVPRIWGYVRMSSSKQEKSPEVQADLIRKYAATLDGFFAGCRLDAAVSGSKETGVTFAKRKEARKLLNDMLSGDHLIIWKIDRLGRNTIDICSILDMLVQRGINIYVLNFAGGRLDLTTATGRAFVGMLAVFAELESGLISERTKEGMAYLKQSGLAYHGRPHYGHRKVWDPPGPGQTKPKLRWEKHEGECNAIKEIYTRSMAGESMERIYNDFRARKLKTADGLLWAPKPYDRKKSSSWRFYRVLKWYKELLARGESI